MAKGNNAQKKETKKPKKNQKIKGNGFSKVPVGRKYPGTLPIHPDFPGTSRPGSY